LRPGVKFRHGKEFEAEDVVYTFNRLLDPDVGSPIAATLDFVTNVAALDERTVAFYLDSPNAYLPDLVTLYHARIIPSDIVSERLATEEFGTGPFILKEHVADERIVMTRNSEYWWEGYPYLDRVVFFYIPDPETRAGALTSGVVDVIHDLVPSSVPALEANPETRVSEAASAAYINLAMDMRVPPFDNILVRKALQAATDREAILRAAQFGKGEIAYDHPITPSDPHFWEGSQEAVAPYDVDRAKALLEEAGYPDGIDLTLHTSTSVATMVEMAVVFKDRAAPAGIRVSIQREPEENYWTDVWMVQPFTTVWWGGRAPDEALSVVYKSDAEWNESRYDNPRVDELIIKARSQADLADRRESYGEIQRILIDEVPRIIPVFGPIFRGLRLNVHDCEANQKSKLLLYRCWLDD
jgi:peptide/nickel transport system substrate-binding protein